MNSVDNDIIIALATPYGKSAVAAIRMSGSGSKALARRFLVRPLAVGELKYNTFVSGNFTEHLMAVAFESPRSYTGEQTVEFYPHGNMAVCETIIKTLIEAGARQAERGEFTMRAFQNGKLDLMQCEALADIIDAQTSEQLVYGNKRYDGGFKALGEVENLLKNALALIEAALHYSDELEGEEVDGEIDEVKSAIDRAISALCIEKQGFAGGKIINDGFKVALLGKPNVGKSTLLNALTGSDRAIVTAVAGTTRDTVEGSYVYGGRKFAVTDTAGLNDDTADEVEIIGIKRAVAAAKSADAVVYVTVDGKVDIDLSEYERPVVVMNKCDGVEEFGTEYGKSGDILRISAKNGINITALKQKLLDMCPKDYGSVCNHRQYKCVCRCLDSLVCAQKELNAAGGLEIVAALLYEGYSAITELYGEQADESVISEVFSRFCVGK